MKTNPVGRRNRNWSGELKNGAVLFALLAPGLLQAGFVTMNSGVTTELRDVWGTAPDNVWAVGAGGVILHYDGNPNLTWTQQGAGLTGASLHSIIGNGPNNVYAAAGSVAQPQATAILLYNGTDWSALPVPGFPVWDIWLAESGELYAVGGAFIINFYIPAVSVWKNGAWREMWLANPGRRAIAAATGFSASDVVSLVVGDTTDFFRYDGNALTQPPAEGAGVGRWSQTGATGGGLGNAWLGRIINPAPPHHLLVVEITSFAISGLRAYSYQNGSPTAASLPNANSVVNRPAGAWGTSVADNLFVVGENNDGHARIGHFDGGTAWRNVSVPLSLDTPGTGLRAVWGFNTTPNQVFVVGAGGTIGRIEPDGPLTISIAPAQVVEPNTGTASLVFNVTLSRQSDDFVEVSGVTSDVTATVGVDYVEALDLYVEFEPGETLKTMVVEVIGDFEEEPNEILAVTLSDAFNATILTPGALGTILDNDGDPEPPEFDYGDAPDGPAEPNYPTTLARDGARHILIANGPRLGAEVDADPGTLHSATATADDQAGDDEDGVSFLTPWAPGSTTQIKVSASTAAKLDAWLDFNADGDWDDPGEQIFASAAVNAGDNTLNVPVPAGAVPGLTLARFRLSSAGGLGYVGVAADGEVEDYQALLTGPIILVDPGVAGSGSFTLVWPAGASSFVLQRTDDLTNPDWTVVTNYTVDGDENRLLVGVNEFTEFFRLIRVP